MAVRGAGNWTRLAENNYIILKRLDLPPEITARAGGETDIWSDDMSLIYEPKGKAREYAELALNLYVGCGHGCTYCYGPRTAHVSRERFHKEPRLKKDVLKRLASEAKEMAGDPRVILISFFSDPYFSEEAAEITRAALEILGANKLQATILTKAGMGASLDFWLMKLFGFGFGTSLVWWDDEKRAEWEPGAASVGSRKLAIQAAKRNWGLRTWVSLEPVIEPAEALQVIRELHDVVDHWKVGKVNYLRAEEAPPVDWVKFLREATGLLDELGADYYIKDSLKKYR